MKKVFRVALTTIVCGVVVGVLVTWITSLIAPGAIWACMKWVWAILATTVRLPVWAIALLVLGLIVLRRIFFPPRREPAEKAEKVAKTVKAEKPWLSYVSDSFWGVQWQWKYSGDEVPFSSIVARCPKCKSLLKHETYSRAVEFSCHHCDFTKLFKMSWGELIDTVVREVDRKIVTGKYKSVVQETGQTE